jgi:hypothetical protein
MSVDLIRQYAKAVAPLVAGIVVLLIDKLGDDSIDDGVWIALLSASPVVGIIPNKPKPAP